MFLNHSNSQGPCYEGEWLVAVRNVTSACVKNPCYGRVSLSPTNLQESKQVFGFIHADGKCYNTESQAFCGNGLVARFVSGRNTPECVNPNKQNCESPNTNLGYSLIPSGSSSCGDGETPSADGRCLSVEDV